MTINKKLFVLILGMHRSGTSCLAGALERCGLHLGEVRRTGRFNQKGYYELRPVQRLHNQILGLNRGSWHSPPSQIQVHPYHRQQLEKIAGQLSRRRPCGLKDPRLLLLLDAWIERITLPCKLVGAFRHPLAVARSLVQRNGIPEESGIKLWKHYNEILIQRHQVEPFPIIEFDLSDVEAYCRGVAALAQALDLSPKLSHLRYFVSRDLDHHPVADFPVPEECCQAYAYLRDHRFQSEELGKDGRWGSRRVANGLNQIIGAVQEVVFSFFHHKFFTALTSKKR